MLKIASSNKEEFLLPDAEKERKRERERKQSPAYKVEQARKKRSAARNTRRESKTSFSTIADALKGVQNEDYFHTEVQGDCAPPSGSVLLTDFGRQVSSSNDQEDRGSDAGSSRTGCSRSGSKALDRTPSITESGSFLSSKRKTSVTSTTSNGITSKRKSRGSTKTKELEMPTGLAALSGAALLHRAQFGKHAPARRIPPGETVFVSNKSDGCIAKIGTVQLDGVKGLMRQPSKEEGLRRPKSSLLIDYAKYGIYVNERTQQMTLLQAKEDQDHKKKMDAAKTNLQSASHALGQFHALGLLTKKEEPVSKKKTKIKIDGKDFFGGKAQKKKDPNSNMSITRDGKKKGYNIEVEGLNVPDKAKKSAITFP